VDPRRLVARPINALAGVARRMAGGELDARAEPKGSSEQIEVATAFNEMAGRLAAVLESQRAFVADAFHQLRTPLTGLRLRLEAAAARSGRAAGEELEAAERETERLHERDRPLHRDPNPARDRARATDSRCVRRPG
jgi:two-component system, OmpR family, sensor kinase